jgi:hypothetical protein
MCGSQSAERRSRRSTALNVFLSMLSVGAEPFMRPVTLLLRLLLTIMVSASLAFAQPAEQRPWLAEPMIWGVNGHPFTAYPNISFSQQLDDVERLGLRFYRANTRGDGSARDIDRMLPLIERRGMVLVPMISIDVDWRRDRPEAIRRRAFELARGMGIRYRGRIPIWSLGNELETYALLRPCETRDNGEQYPCDWGVAIGRYPDEYQRDRWNQVSAFLDGLSDGMKEGDPTALRVIGVSGWGRFGALERLSQDGVEWDITDWHDYEGMDEAIAARLARFGKPIWITEFHIDERGLTAEARAERLALRIASYQALRARYPIAGAFMYELYDEPYWGDTFEARMGLISLRRSRGGFWEVGPDHPAASAFIRAIAEARFAEAGRR